MNYFIRTFTLSLLASLLFTMTACDDAVIGDDDMMEVEEEEESMTAIVWSGDTVTFEKLDGTDPTLEENQDRITDDVWITRGTAGGQIYNAVTEENSDKDGSPSGTLWAVGTTAELSSLEFAPFRQTVEKPKDAIGIDLVMIITGASENIAIDIKFTSWSQGNANGGGFAYERSTN